MFDEIKVANIGKSIEQERDFWHKGVKIEGIHMTVLQRQINIFLSIYILSMSSDDEIKWIEKDTKKQYISYYQTKFNWVRFLFELFLTTLEILNKASKRDRDYLAFSLCLSERLNEHIELDLYILDIDPKNPAYLAKVQKNEQEFPKFLGKFMPKWVTVEQDLWVLTKKVMGKDKSVANLWFLYCKHNKLNYSSIVNDNELLGKLLDRLQKVWFFSKAIDRTYLRKIYFSLSNHSHPTVTTITEFEGFIWMKTDEKLKTIKRGRDEYDQWLRVMWILMDALCKEARGVGIETISYAKVK